MSGRGSCGVVRAAEASTEPLARFFANEPSVGFAIVDDAGVVRFINWRSSELFLGRPPSEAIGQVVWDLFDHAWVEERMSVFARMLEHNRPVLFRHILRGQQLQSTLRLLPVEPGESPAVSIVTVVGEFDPPSDAGFEIVESSIADLGPLSSLTRRELEVLALLGHGMSSAQIANALFRSPRTIEKHLDGLRTKLGNASRLELAAVARTAGLRLSDATLRRSSARVETRSVDPDPAKRERP